MIYLDYNATTPVAEGVLEEMLPAFTADFGNPSNTSHAPGRRASRLVDVARERVGTVLQANPGRVIFTSGSTEALNLAIKGLTLPPGRNRFLIGATEHKAVLEAAAARTDVTAELLPVRGDGTLDLDALEDALADDVALVAYMAVNNETGVIHPIAKVQARAASVGAMTLCDATQAVGRIALDDVAKADLVALSAHKIYGPKGVGCLVGSREGLRALNPVVSGGGQERGLRSGTLNVPGIVGLGAAVALVTADLDIESERQRQLRDLLQSQIQERLGDVHLNGHPELRVCNTLNLRFEGADGEAILTNLRQVAASAGSACQSAVPVASHVLRAMGLTAVEADRSLRFSLGRPTTAKEIEAAVDDVVSAVTRVRELESESGEA